MTPWSGFPTAGELVARYSEHSDRDMSGLDWYEVMGCFKLAIILEGTHVRALSGAAAMAVGESLHGHAVSLMDRALRRLA